MEESRFVRVPPSLCQEEEDDPESLETLTDGEGTHLNCHNKPSPCKCALPGHPPPPTPTTDSLFFPPSFFRL